MRAPLFAFAVALVASVVLRAPASAAPAANGWKIYSYNASGQALRTNVAATDSGIAGFDFLDTADDALLATDQPSANAVVLGDLTGKTISATFHIDATADATFTYYGEGTPDNSCASPASVRLYFQTKATGAFDPKRYWWSNPAHVDLRGGAGAVSAPLTPGQWSDWDGHENTDAADGDHLTAFANAVKDVTLVGLSFGGGCFFENGVGMKTGTASFHLDTFAAN